MSSILRVERTDFVKGILILLGAFVTCGFSWTAIDGSKNAEGEGAIPLAIKLALAFFVVLLAVSLVRSGSKGEGAPSRRPRPGEFASSVVFSLPRFAFLSGLGIVVGTGLLAAVMEIRHPLSGVLIVGATHLCLAIPLLAGGPVIAELLAWRKREFVVAWLALAVASLVVGSKDLAAVADRHGAAFVFGSLGGLGLRELWRGALRSRRVDDEERDDYVEKYSPAKFLRGIVVLALLITVGPIVVNLDIGVPALLVVALVGAFVVLRGVWEAVSRFGGAWLAVALTATAFVVDRGSSRPLLMPLAALALALEAFEIARPWGLPNRVVVSRLIIGAVAGLFSTPGSAFAPTWRSLESALFAIDPAVMLLGALLSVVSGGLAVVFASLVCIPVVYTVVPLAVATLLGRKNRRTLAEASAFTRASKVAGMLAWPLLVLVFGSGLLQAFGVLVGWFNVRYG